MPKQLLRSHHVLLGRGCFVVDVWTHRKVISVSNPPSSSPLLGWQVPPSTGLSSWLQNMANSISVSNAVRSLARFTPQTSGNLYCPRFLVSPRDTSSPQHHWFPISLPVLSFPLSPQPYSYPHSHPNPFLPSSFSPFTSQCLLFPLLSEIQTSSLGLPWYLTYLGLWIVS